MNLDQNFTLNDIIKVVYKKYNAICDVISEKANILIDKIGDKMVQINGKTYDGNSVVINNGTVIIDGKVVNELYGTKEIVIQGNVGSIECDGAVSVTGDVTGDVSCGGSFKGNNVGGNVNSGGSFKGSKVGGNANSGGSMRIG